jgi:hypothetical protein
MRQTVKKIFLYFFIFVLFFGANLILIKKIISQTKKEAQIENLLSEIGEIKNNSFSTSALPQVLGAYQTEAQLADGRIANLKHFFRKYNSPLYDYAELIVSVSDKYGFDYRLLPAIAMQESNLCHYIPENSYNCWGWGIYGDQVMRFSSYDEAIETIATGIKKEYIDKGLVTASKIMEKYTPSSPGTWARGVNTFLRMLE